MYSATLYDSLLTYAMAAKKIKDDYYLENDSQDLAVKEAAAKKLIKNGTNMAQVSRARRLMYDFIRCTKISFFSFFFF